MLSCGRQVWPWALQRRWLCAFQTGDPTLFFLWSGLDLPLPHYTCRLQLPCVLQLDHTHHLAVQL